MQEIYAEVKIKTKTHLFTTLLLFHNSWKAYKTQNILSYGYLLVSFYSVFCEYAFELRKIDLNLKILTNIEILLYYLNADVFYVLNSPISLLSLKRILPRAPSYSCWICVKKILNDFFARGDGQVMDVVHIFEQI